MNEKAIPELKKILSETKKIAILTHINPDGDAIGSALAMLLYLKQKKHHTKVIVPNDIPVFLKWMPGSEDIVVNTINPHLANEAIKEAEVIFCLDFNSLKRIEKLGDILKKSTAVKILFDHHIEPENFTDYVFSNTRSSSTAEIVYEFIVEMTDEGHIDKDIAKCLYVGIATDTGSFSFSCNNSRTYDIVANLMKQGIDVEHIHRLVYDTYSEDRMRLLGYCLSKKMTVISKHNTAYICLSKKELEQFNHQTGDTEGVVNFPLSIGAVKMAVLFIEKDDHIRISIRSKGDLDVNSIARIYFDGGGHKNAAGANSYLSMEQTINKFINLLPELNFI